MTIDHQLQLDRPVTVELRRIADGLLADAQSRADDPEDVDDAIHELRKRCKETRGLIRLVRGASESLHQRENAAVRDAARRLSDIRDATAGIETYDALAEALGQDAMSAVTDVRAALVERRDRVHAEQDALGLLRRAADDLCAVRERIPEWTLPTDGFDALAGGLRKTYGRARRRMADAAAEPTSERWHEWRKRVKYHRYHLEMLERMWPPVVAARREEVHHLTDLLGDDHDLAVLREEVLDDLAEQVDVVTLEVFLALVDRRRATLQAEALPLGRRLFADDPDVFVARAAEYHAAALDEPDPVELADPVIAPGA